MSDMCTTRLRNRRPSGVLDGLTNRVMRWPSRQRLVWPRKMRRSSAEERFFVARFDDTMNDALVRGGSPGISVAARTMTASTRMMSERKRDLHSRVAIARPIGLEVRSQLALERKSLRRIPSNAKRQRVLIVHVTQVRFMCRGIEMIEQDIRTHALPPAARTNGRQRVPTVRDEGRAVSD